MWILLGDVLNGDPILVEIAFDSVDQSFRGGTEPATAERAEAYEVTVSQVERCLSVDRSLLAVDNDPIGAGSPRLTTVEAIGLMSTAVTQQRNL